MKTIRIWKGEKYRNWGKYEICEFTGRKIGYKKDVDKNDARYYTVYRAYETEDGAFVVHRVCVAPLDDGVEATIFFHDSLEDTVGWDGLIPR